MRETCIHEFILLKNQLQVILYTTGHAYFYTRTSETVLQHKKRAATFGLQLFLLHPKDAVSRNKLLYLKMQCTNAHKNIQSAGCDFFFEPLNQR